MDSQELYKTGSAYFKVGKIKEAEMHISKSLEKDSTNKQALCYKLLILMKSKKYSKAYDESKKVVEMFPEDPFVLATAGTAYMQKKITKVRKSFFLNLSKLNQCMLLTEHLV